MRGTLDRKVKEEVIIASRERVEEGTMVALVS